MCLQCKTAGGTANGLRLNKLLAAWTRRHRANENSMNDSASIVAQVEMQCIACVEMRSIAVSSKQPKILCEMPVGYKSKIQNLKSRISRFIPGAIAFGVDSDWFRLIHRYRPSHQKIPIQWVQDPLPGWTPTAQRIPNK